MYFKVADGWAANDRVRCDCRASFLSGFFLAESTPPGWLTPRSEMATGPASATLYSIFELFFFAKSLGVFDEGPQYSL